MKKKQQYSNKELDELSAHRKRWLPAPVRDKRYIRGMINKKVKELINPRKQGDQTTDKNVKLIVLAKTKNRCFYCHRLYVQDVMKAELFPELYFLNLEIDHLVPHSHHGPNAIANYVPACRRCNQLKSDMSLSEFLPLLRADIRQRGY